MGCKTVPQEQVGSSGKVEHTILHMEELTKDDFLIKLRDDSAEAAEEEETWEAKPRVEMPKLSPEKRKTSFQEIELGLSEERAREEARRCLRCDLEA